MFARQQQLPNCTLFQTVLHDDVFGDGFGEDRLFLDWRRFCRILEYMHLQHMQMHVEVDDFIFRFASAGICNKLWRTMCMYARTWFKHVARRNKRNRDNTAQWLAESLRHFTCLFVCCEKKVRVRSSFRIELVLLACVCKFIHRHRRCCTDPNA